MGFEIIVGHLILNTHTTGRINRIVSCPPQSPFVQLTIVLLAHYLNLLHGGTTLQQVCGNVSLCLPCFFLFHCILKDL